MQYARCFLNVHSCFGVCIIVYVCMNVCGLYIRISASVVLIASEYYLV